MIRLRFTCLVHIGHDSVTCDVIRVVCGVPTRDKIDSYVTWCHLRTMYVTCDDIPSVAVRCSVLQCVAVRCSVLQCVAVRCSVLQCVAVSCDIRRSWQHVTNEQPMSYVTACRLRKTYDRNTNELCPCVGTPHVWHGPFYDIRIWHGSFVSDTAHSHEMWDMSCHTWISHVTYEWGIANMNESCHICPGSCVSDKPHSHELCLSHVTFFMSHLTFFMSHVTYEWLMSHVNEACHMWISHFTYECVFEAYHTWMSRVQ
jgi:hypothetical protein